MLWIVARAARILGMAGRRKGAEGEGQVVDAEGSVAVVDEGGAPLDDGGFAPVPAVPWPPRAIGEGKDSPERRARAIERLSQGFSITAAARAAGIDRRSLLRWRRRDPDFDAACKAAIDAGTDSLEDAAIVRATEGTPIPTFYKGEIVGYSPQVSDRLMELFLKARRPDRFRERVDHAVVVAPLTPEQLAKARERGLDPKVEEAAALVASVPVIPAGQDDEASGDPPS